MAQWFRHHTPRRGAQARPRARGLDPTCQPKGHRQQLEMHMLQLRPGAATQVNMNKRERG